MGRIRTVKPEFTMNEELSALPAETHLFAVGLLCYADDYGYFNANAGLLKAAVFPLREPSVSTHDMLAQLAGIGFVRLGKTPDGKRWGHIVTFNTHQRVSHPTPSKISKLKIEWEDSWSPPEDLPKNSGGLTEDSSPEGKGKEVGSRNGEIGTWKGKGSAGAGPPSPAAPISRSENAWNIARAVSVGTGLTNRWAIDQLASQAEVELRNKGDTEEAMNKIRDDMVTSWKLYNACAKAGKLRKDLMPAEKFYGEGRWKDSKLWGLKDGKNVFDGSRIGSQTRSDPPVLRTPPSGSAG